MVPAFKEIILQRGLYRCVIEGHELWKRRSAGSSQNFPGERASDKHLTREEGGIKVTVGHWGM